MKKFEARAAKGKRAGTEKLEAPIVLTPEQLEAVAGGIIGFLSDKTTSTTTTGAVPPSDLLKGLLKIGALR